MLYFAGIYPPWNEPSPWTWWFPMKISFSRGLFSGAILVSMVLNFPKPDKIIQNKRPCFRVCSSCRLNYLHTFCKDLRTEQTTQLESMGVLACQRIGVDTQTNELLVTCVQAEWLACHMSGFQLYSNHKKSDHAPKKPLSRTFSEHFWDSEFKSYEQREMMSLSHHVRLSISKEL